MEQTNVSATKMATGLFLTLSVYLCDKTYQSSIVPLMYLMAGSHPDLAFNMKILSKFLKLHGDVHWSSLKKVMGYVIQTKDLGLHYRGTNADPTPLVYVDAYWAGDHYRDMSMSGCVIIISGAAVVWYKRNQ